MKTYTITVFEKSGKKLMDETFEAQDDNQARTLGEQLLDEKQYSNHTSRVISPTGKLVHFHR